MLCMQTHYQNQSYSWQDIQKSCYANAFCLIFLLMLPVQSIAYQLGNDNLIDWQFDQTPYADHYDANGIVIVNTSEVHLPYNPELLNVVNESFPPTVDINQANSSLLQALENFHLSFNGSLSYIDIFPLTESANYKNSLAYFWYDADSEPNAPTDIYEHIIYPNFSLDGSNNLTLLHKVTLQNLPTNANETNLGFSLIQNGFSYADGVRRNMNQNGIFFSISGLNPEVSDEFKMHHFFIFDPVSELIIVGFEDQHRENQSSDHDFNDTVFAIKVEPINAVDLSNIPHLLDCNASDNSQLIDLYCQSPSPNPNQNSTTVINNFYQINTHHSVHNHYHNNDSDNDDDNSDDSNGNNNNGNSCQVNQCSNPNHAHSGYTCTLASTVSNVSAQSSCSSPSPSSDGDADLDGLADASECPLLIACPDHDNDGTPNYIDLDSDNNGILDTHELTPFYDTDSDGIPDYADSNDDNDEYDDRDEYDSIATAWNEDLDCDRIPNIKDPSHLSYCTTNSFENAQFNDSDQDGLSDNFEFGESTPWARDTDNDLIPDYMDPDSDNDQYSDDLEADGIEQLTPVGPGIATDSPLDLNQNNKADVIEYSHHSLAMNDIGQRYIITTDDEANQDQATSQTTNQAGAEQANDDEQIKTSRSGHGAGSTHWLILLSLGLLLSLRDKTSLVSQISRLKYAIFCAALLMLQTPNSLAESLCYTKDINNRSEACWYLGVGIGLSHLSPDTDGTNWDIEDDNSEGFLIRAGYRFHPKWTAELNYFDLGEAQIKHRLNDGQASIEYQAVMLSGHYALYQSEKIELDVLLGITDLMTDSDDANIEDQNTISLSLGAQVSYHIDSHWFARLSAYSLDEDAQHINLSINRFLGSAKKTSSEPAAPKSQAVITDKDGDGVLDENDLCPDTPKGETVKEDGCHHEKLNIDKLYFPPRSAELTVESKQALNDQLSILKSFRPSTIIVTAHTDNMGSDLYNQQLSQARAESVVQFLQSQNMPHKFIAVGKGEREPVTSNDTVEGRAKNRRVELEVVN